MSLRKVNVDTMLGELGIDSNVDLASASVTKLLVVLIEETKRMSDMLRLLGAASDIGMDWDTYETYVVPGAVATCIVNVPRQERFIVKVQNNDLDNARPIYYSREKNVEATMFRGLKYNLETTRVLYVDFNVGGGELNAAVAAAAYDGETLAAAIEAAMDTAYGTPNMFTVTYNPALKTYDATADSSLPSFSLLVNSGANSDGGTGFNLYDEIGWIKTADKTGAMSYAGDNPKFNEYGTEFGGYQIPFILQPGESATVVLEGESLYAISETENKLNVPVLIRRSRITDHDRASRR